MSTPRRTAATLARSMAPPPAPRATLTRRTALNLARELVPGPRRPATRRVEGFSLGTPVTVAPRPVRNQTARVRRTAANVVPALRTARNRLQATLQQVQDASRRQGLQLTSLRAQMPRTIGVRKRILLQDRIRHTMKLQRSSIQMQGRLQQALERLRPTLRILTPVAE